MDAPLKEGRAGKEVQVSIFDADADWFEDNDDRLGIREESGSSVDRLLDTLWSFELG